MILPSVLAERRSSAAADGENLFPIKPFGLRISAFSLPVKDSENAGVSIMRLVVYAGLVMVRAGDAEMGNSFK